MTRHSESAMLIKNTTLRLGNHEVTGLMFDWAAIEEILRMIELDGLPDDPADPRCMFEAAVKNAKDLRILFGGQWDKAAMDKVHALAAEIVTMREWQARTSVHVSRQVQ